jgi:hypothetical protein
MPYIIGFGLRNKREVSTTEAETAVEALKIAEALEMSDEEIKFVDCPGEGRFDMRMLRVLAKEEEQRNAKRP